MVQEVPHDTGSPKILRISGFLEGLLQQLEEMYIRILAYMITYAISPEV